MDEEAAVEKFKLRYKKEPFIDEGLRGMKTSFTKTEVASFSHHVFPYGKLQCMSIAESDDVWQLKRVLNDGGGVGNPKEFGTLKVEKRRALARRRLVELGELVRHDHYGKVWNDEKSEWEQSPKILKYMNRREYQNFMKAKHSVYYGVDGARVDLSLKETHRTGYDSAYGFTHIITYQTESGEEYIYKGGSPADISDKEFTRVKATIKHSLYKDIKQSLIQRIKTI
jgi:hypothetical protein